MQLPTSKELGRVFLYDPDSGRLLRYTDQGLVTAGYRNKDGYIATEFKDRPFRAHRIAWALMTGAWPEAEIDHINGIRHDNRWGNLREATRLQNAANTPCKKSNALKVKGVHYDTARQSYRAQIMVNRKKINLGNFKTVSEAAEAYAAGASRYHGAFANTGEFKHTGDARQLTRREIRDRAFTARRTAQLSA